MTKIVSIKLSFWLLNFRAYSKSAKSGGGATSGSGGGQTSSSVTTPSGGGSTSGATGSASGGGSTTPSGGGSTTPSGGGATSGSGGGQTSSTESQYHAIPYIVGNILAHNGGWLISGYSQNLQVAAYAHTHTVADHTHSTPAHTHTTPNHIHNTPDHTHPNHTHSTPNHTHPAHTHTVDNHTHSTPDHVHDIDYGIYEEETSPTVMVYISRDNGLTYSLPIGSYSNNQEILDITRFIDTKGSKMIKFESNVRARLSVQIEIKLDIRAR